MLAELLTTASTTVSLGSGAHAWRLRMRLRTDPLTGLGNRAALERLARRHQRHHPGQLCGLVLCDLDHFKRINDTHGHRAGDIALRAVADQLRANARPNERAIRLHGDEFALWLGATSPTAAEHRARQLRTALATPLPLDGHTIQLTCSAGTATDPAGRLDHLLAAADAAMYTAKRHRPQPLPTTPTEHRARDTRKTTPTPNNDRRTA